MKIHFYMMKDVLSERMKDKYFYLYCEAGVKIIHEED